MATWSLRLRAVCRRPPASPMRAVSFDSTFMWMSSSSGIEGDGAALDALLHLLEPRHDALGVLGAQDALARQHARVRNRPRHVVGQESIVEADGGVQRGSVGVERFGEAPTPSPLLHVQP